MQVALVRHAAVAADPALPAAWWPLSDGGRAATRRLARWPGWGRIERIFASPEVKAHETAQIIAGCNGLTVTLVEELGEVARPAGVWHADYAAAVRAYFARPEEATHGWEPPAAATARITACLARLTAWEGQPFAVVGHGLTLSLYLAALTGTDPAAIWPRIALPDLAIVDPARRAILRPFGHWQTDENRKGAKEAKSAKD